MLRGEPGIGKTTLWEAGLALARERGLRVLVARPSEPEASFSFAGLVDLCEDLPLDGLPEPQRAALEVVLLRRAREAAPAYPHAVGLALRSALAAAAPALVAIDDVQWLDGLSADALAFAARRLDGARVGFLLTQRAGAAGLPLRSPQVVDLGPLSAGELREVVGERLGVQLPVAELQEIAAASLGNPLFALELARAGGAVPAALEELLGVRVKALPDDERHLLLAVALGADLRLDELELLSDGVRAAVAAGLLVADGERVRAGHPLLAAAARAGALPSERRAVHEALAEVVRDPERAALHRALATEAPDEELAVYVAGAAERAAARGARPEAVALGEQALRLTPRDQVGAPWAGGDGAAWAGEAGAAAGDDGVGGVAGAAAAGGDGAVAGEAWAGGGDAAGSPSAAWEGGDGAASGDGVAPGGPWAQRVLALAGYLESAGERRRVHELLAPVLDRLPAGAARVRAWLLLAESGVETAEDYRRHLDRALEAAGDDPALRRRVLALTALHLAAEGVVRIPQAEAWALESLPEPDALRALGWARALRGRDIDGVISDFHAAAAPGSHLIDSPAPLAALRRAWRGEIAHARAETTRFLDLAAERGENVGYAWLRLNLCEIELRAGEWDAAERWLDEWEASDEGQLLITPTYQRCRALLAVGRGDAAAARGWAAPALEEAVRRGYTWQVLESRRALGLAALLAGETDAAAEELRFVWAHCEREGVDEPGAFPVAADLLEALGELGAEDEAAAVRDRLALLLPAHPWAAVTLARAAGKTEAAAKGYERLGLRFDAARTRLAAGRAARRARQWKAARAALTAAAETFDALGSPGWAEQARAELARVGGRKPRADATELTQTERQVAELAAAGRTNKEIAAALFVTTHTVEAHLTKVYAKLGLRSRTELAARL